MRHIVSSMRNSVFLFYHETIFSMIHVALCVGIAARYIE
ncbi:hypothetical protein B4119_3763 [Parageobacillus caldoxylosilyticus]|uniref:Uncharacterized protein n=1 Tax=Saccharococcus caldoxylosilyticus TaxID=81408 RepID=A0A150M370_9BACL|nr:hypothetical protein B4119_3763 [Parageobacillus caldoxylosilyticus]